MYKIVVRRRRSHRHRHRRTLNRNTSRRGWQKRVGGWGLAGGRAVKALI